ncbi:MAG: hypothetical protein JNK82_17635, partial [Myxococcaceae bacterium]|nr:hypothetical protein [Myxococcaceae bacterium]
MKGISIKLPEETIRRLRNEAYETGLTLGELIRMKLSEPSQPYGATVWDLSHDLLGTVDGGKRSA